MGTQAEFALLECGSSIDATTGNDKLWRRYILAMEGFECDIIEVFPDREMFTDEAWIEAPETLVKGVEEAKERYQATKRISLYA